MGVMTSLRDIILFMFVSCYFPAQSLKVSFPLSRKLIMNSTKLKSMNNKETSFFVDTVHAVESSKKVNVKSSKSTKKVKKPDLPNINSCTRLTGVAAMQCLKIRSAKDIREVSRLGSATFLKKATIMAIKIKKISTATANDFQKHDFSFSFLQIQDYLRDCSKLIGIPKLGCLARLGADRIEKTEKNAAIDILDVADKTAKKVLDLTAPMNKISGLEDLSQQVKQTTNKMVNNARTISKKISNSGKTAAENIKKIIGRTSQSFLEVDADSCKNLNGVLRMKCLTEKAAKKIIEIRDNTYNSFMKETNNLVNKIRKLGDKTANDIKSYGKFDYFTNGTTVTKRSKKDVNIKAVNSILTNCIKFDGLAELNCIIKDTSNQIRMYGISTSQEIKTVAETSASVVMEVASTLLNIVGFEKISKNMSRGASLLQSKGYELANSVNKSSFVMARNVEVAAGCTG